MNESLSFILKVPISNLIAFVYVLALICLSVLDVIATDTCAEGLLDEILMVMLVGGLSTFFILQLTSSLLQPTGV
jgi:hypothetical protein